MSNLLEKTSSKDITINRDVLILYLLKNYCNSNSLDINILYTYLKKNNIVVNNLEKIQDFHVHDILSPTLQSLNNNNTYDIINKIGNGSYGNVFKIKNKIDNKNYALKITKIYDNRTLREAQNMALLDHENIVRYYSSWMEPANIYNNNLIELDEIGSSKSYDSLVNENNYMFIQMELCNKTLSNYINTRNMSITNLCKKEYDKSIHIFKQIVTGLNYLHKKNIIHRDIKPSNILFCDNIIKICDFGLSVNISNKKDIPQLIGSRDFGTFIYLAPEVIDNNYYSIYSDIYSISIILFELLNIFNTEMERYTIINHMKEHNTKNKEISNFKRIYFLEYNFIQKLLNKIPSKRLTTDQILKIDNLVNI